jgi:hypothetical protein
MPGSTAAVFTVAASTEAAAALAGIVSGQG